MVKKTSKIAFVGIFAASAAVLSTVERLICAGFALPPGVRLGLSNIAVMLCTLAAGVWSALLLAIIKAVFALFTGGFVSFALGASGGILSALFTGLLLRAKKCPLGFSGIGVCGALLHNGAQLTVCCLLFFNSFNLFVFYAPVLTVSALISGFTTGSLLKLLSAKIT
jgi:heptaprenyl diphosphate synthase